MKQGSKGQILEMGSEHYCLRWNNHQSNLLGVFSQLLQDESLVDVTLACEGHSLRAHKVVLSACSSFFQTLFIDHPDRHPIVILKDVKFSELKTLLEFMYKGEVNVEYNQLSALLHTAESLRVKGLVEMTTSVEKRSSPPPLPLSLETPKRAADSSPPLELATTNKSSSTPTSQTTQRCRHESGGGGHTSESENEEEDEDEPMPEQLDERPSSGPTASITVPPVPGEPPGGLTSPRADPLPGPSGLLPVQQVPLSLKKEVDWGDRSNTGDDKSTTGESSSEYRSGHDPDDITSPEVMLIEGSYSSPPNFATSSPPSSPHFSPPFPFSIPSSTGIPTITVGDGQPAASLASLLQSGGAEALQRFLSGENPPEGTIRCPVCLAFFPASMPLDQHMCLHSREKPFKCDQCGQCYKYQSAYAKHREQNHTARLPGEKPFRCEICGMQFRYLKSFKKHRLNHAVERLHSTRADTTEDTSLLARLYQQAASQQQQRVEAPDNHVTSSNEAISSSTRGANNNSRGGVTSNKDGIEQDSTIDSLAIALALASNNTAAASTSTSEQSSSLYNLLRLDEIHKRFTCVFCHKSFRSKENLKLHVRKHTGEKPFECEFCGRAFGGKSDMNRHLRIHTGERPYHCEICGKCFARADYLSKHLTTHLNNSSSH